MFFPGSVAVDHTILPMPAVFYLLLLVLVVVYSLDKFLNKVLK